MAAQNNNNGDKPATGLSPLMRGLFVVSLALNLLVIGGLGSWALRHGGMHVGHHPSRLDMAGGPLTRALSDEDRREIGEKMRGAYRDGGRTRAAQHAGFDALVADLRAVPFDPASVAARMSEQREGFRDRLELGQRLLLDHLATMSDAERAAYADRLEVRIDEYRARRAHSKGDRD
ncbi:MAG: periplasmic heavy metal sensor [Roseovarius sp.]|nr:periplasmic heavy metal sensor [Roseovarius sp.]